MVPMANRLQCIFYGGISIRHQIIKKANNQSDACVYSQSPGGEH